MHLLRFLKAVLGKKRKKELAQFKTILQESHHIFAKNVTHIEETRVENQNIALGTIAQPSHQSSRVFCNDAKTITTTVKTLTITRNRYTQGGQVGW